MVSAFFESVDSLYIYPSRAMSSDRQTFPNSLRLPPLSPLNLSSLQTEELCRRPSCSSQINS